MKPRDPQDMPLREDDDWWWHTLDQDAEEQQRLEQLAKKQFERIFNEEN